MVKKLFLLTIVLIFSLVTLASAADLSQLLNQVKSTLLQKGVAAADVNTIQPTVSNLLGLGINKENLVKIVTDLVALGVKGNILNSPLQALKDLVKSGEKPNLASNLISLAIDQAKTQNLTGNAAVSKIVDFINQKKAEFLQLKQQAQGKIQDQKDKINNSLGSLLGK
jgi:predicted XRE-type DNA-binding protein